MPSPAGGRLLDAQRHVTIGFGVEFPGIAVTGIGCCGDDRGRVTIADALEGLDAGVGMFAQVLLELAN